MTRMRLLSTGRAPLARFRRASSSTKLISTRTGRLLSRSSSSSGKLLKPLVTLRRRSCKSSTISRAERAGSDLMTFPRLSKFASNASVKRKKRNNERARPGGAHFSAKLYAKRNEQEAKS